MLQRGYSVFINEIALAHLKSNPYSKQAYKLDSDEFWRCCTTFRITTYGILRNTTFRKLDLLSSGDGLGELNHWTTSAQFQVQVQ
jgi:hypothetical protein